MKQNLGKLLKVGETFTSTSKKMIKRKGKFWRGSPQYKLYRVGEKDFFTKGKRQYYCEVRAIVEIRTGIYVTSFDSEWTRNFTNNCWRGPRWWQFSYLVVILEN